MVTVDSQAVTKIREIETGREYPIPVSSFEPTVVAFSGDGHYILIGGSGGSVQIWRPGDRTTFGTLSGHLATVTDASFSDDGKTIITASVDGTVRLWNAATFVELCALAELTDGHWVVMDPEGRFDTDAPGEIQGLHLAFPDNLLKTYSLDRYIQLYYEPRLLSRILARETFPTIRAFNSINTVVPSVQITDIKQEEDRKDRLGVRVSVSCQPPEYDDRSHERLPCEAAEIRLFREGQLVRKAALHVRAPVGSATAQREDVLFDNLRIPNGKATVEFSAYALNLDHVKSETDHRSIPVTRSMRTETDSRVYLITIGVARAGDELLYPAEDARSIQEVS